MGTRQLASSYLASTLPNIQYSPVAMQSPDLVDERTHFLDPKLRLPIIKKI
jgi:hypothetical protein